MACVFGFYSIPIQAATGDGSPGDTNIRYFGRWDISDSTTYKTYWGGTYFKVNFTGTTIKLKLGGTSNIFARIDGAETYYANASGTLDLTPSPLASGAHTLMVATRSVYDNIQFQGLILDAGAYTQVPAVGNKLIEFAGDSITAGYLLTKEALSDYSWLAPEMLGYEHVQTAQSGINLQDNWTSFVPTNIGLSKQFFKLQNALYTTSPDWDFNRYQPDMVVINIGTNDSTQSVPGTTFQQTYTTFLQDIRAKYPNTIILVMKTFIGAFVTETQNAVNDRRNAGDTNVHFIDTTGWLNSGDFLDGVHPSDSGSAKVASKLAPIISEYLSPAGGVLTDEMDDFSKTYSHTANLVFDSTNAALFNGDISRLCRSTPTYENVVYNTAVDMSYFMIDTYFWNSEAIVHNKVYTSPDGTNYTEIIPTITNMGGDWNRYKYESSSLPFGTRYLKIEFRNTSTNNWNPQISRVVINYTPAGAINTNLTYKIVNRNSSKALQPSGGSLADGTNIVQMPYTGVNEQKWQFIDAGGGYYKIRNVNSGKLMDIYGASTADGANNIQWTDNGGANQLWQVIDVGGGYYKIKNKNSGKLLDIMSASTADGAQDIQWTDNGGLNQQWQIAAI